jgi:hypothetical protein
LLKCLFKKIRSIEYGLLLYLALVWELLSADDPELVEALEFEP